jgi:hypothetical protein
LFDPLDAEKKRPYLLRPLFRAVSVATINTDIALVVCDRSDDMKRLVFSAHASPVLVNIGR